MTTVKELNVTHTHTFGELYTKQVLVNITLVNEVCNIDVKLNGNLDPSLLDELSIDYVRGSCKIPSGLLYTPPLYLTPIKIRLIDIVKTLLINHALYK